MKRSLHIFHQTLTYSCTNIQRSREEITDTDKPKTVNDWLTVLRIQDVSDSILDKLVGNCKQRLCFVNHTKECWTIWLTQTCVPQIVFRVTTAILCEDFCYKNSFSARVHKQLESLLRCSSFHIQLFVLYRPVKDFQRRCLKRVLVGNTADGMLINTQPETTQTVRQ
jgi:hypothetical protein